MIALLTGFTVFALFACVSSRSAWDGMQARLRATRDEMLDNDEGYTVESVLVTALLAGLGIAAVGVLSVKVMARARSIDLGP